MFKPSTPPVLPTPEVFLDSVVATRTEIVYCVPSFIEVRLAGCSAMLTEVQN